MVCSRCLPFFFDGHPPIASAAAATESSISLGKTCVCCMTGKSTFVCRVLYTKRDVDATSQRRRRHNVAVKVAEWSQLAMYFGGPVGCKPCATPRCCRVDPPPPPPPPATPYVSDSLYLLVDICSVSPTCKIFPDLHL